MLELSMENKVLDLPAVNAFRIGDEVIADEGHDQYQGVIIGIELQHHRPSNQLRPDITILHDGCVTDGFKPEDLRKVAVDVPVEMLLNCPFCGGAAEFRSVGIGHYVACTRCDSSSVMLKAVKDQVEDDLIEAWNSRLAAPRDIKRYQIFHDEANKPTLVESLDGPVCLFEDLSR